MNPSLGQQLLLLPQFRLATQLQEGLVLLEKLPIIPKVILKRDVDLHVRH